MFERSRGYRPSRCSRLTAGTLVATLWIGSCAAAQESHNAFNLLLLPTSRQAQQTLEQECRLWTQQSLRSALKGITDQYDIAIWLDRRIDPSQQVELAGAMEPSTLGSELDRLARQCGARGGLIENVYLIAASENFARIQRAAVVLHGRLSAATKGSTASRQLQWEDITSSNELLARMGQEWDVPIHGSLPHDLFHGGHLPACTLATQLSLLLGGFDRSATLRTNRHDRSESAAPPDRPLELELVPLGLQTRWQDVYPIAVPAEIERSLRERYGADQLQNLPNSRCLVHGETNLHWEVLAIGLASERKRTRSQAPAQRYTFEVEELVPVEAVIDHLSRGVGLAVEWSPECSAADRNRLVRFHVRNATRSELFRQVCELAGLTLVEEADRVIILPGQAGPP